MKFVICTKFHVNWMNCVESRRGEGPIDPPLPSRLSVAIFSSRVLGLNVERDKGITKTKESILL